MAKKRAAAASAATTQAESVEKAGSKTTGNGQAARQWPASSLEQWPLAKLLPYAKNPRTHAPSQVKYIADLIRRFGWTQPVLVDEQGVLIAGHGRVMAAHDLKIAEVPTIVARGWTPEEVRAYRIADNQATLLSTWDESALKFEMVDLKAADFDLALLGFSQAELIDMDLEPSLGPGLGEADTSRLLKLVDIAIEEPKHQVAHGDHLVLGGRHHLVIASVITEWPRWAPLLSQGTLFCPYAGVFVPFSEKAATHALLMVQPDAYIAGHILDRFAEVHGEPAIVKQ